MQQPPGKSVLKVDIKKYDLPQSKNQTIRTKKNSIGGREREKILNRGKKPKYDLRFSHLKVTIPLWNEEFLELVSGQILSAYTTDQVE